MYEIKNVFKSYGRKLILEDINITIKKGECVGILGVNGSGKSTLLSILAGITKCEKGEFLVDGKDILKDKKMIRQTVGYVPQDNPLLEEISVMDNIRLWSSQDKKEFLEILESEEMRMLEIKKMLNEKVCNLSGGMKKRVSIAIALMKKPQILILDEPGAALDIECKNDIRYYIENVIKGGGTVIISTHDDREIDMCTELYLMEQHGIKQVDSNIFN